jgi:16S rRNA (cytosine967-C5)-methyltransferase
MISPARATAYDLLRRIEARRIFSDDALHSEAIRRLDERDRRLVTEIVYGSLRWRGLLDDALAAASDRPWRKVSPGIRTLLRMSLYQMWFMDRVPDHALVNDAAELAKTGLGRGVPGYVNAVLRRLARERPWTRDALRQKAPPWVRVSLPRWLWERWAARYGEERAEKFALSLNRPPRPSARRGAEGERLPAGASVSDLVPGTYFLDTVDAEAEGSGTEFIQYQDEASQLIPHLLGPIKGWKIWDACAAPGGKAVILRRECGETGRVIAVDCSVERILRMARLVRVEWGAPLDVVAADARRPAPFNVRFDAVLADVPCSGLGTLRRNPEIKWRFRPEEFARLAESQKGILRSVAESVRVGGYLLYSTCSTEPEENERVVEDFLSGRSDFRLQRPLYPRGIEAWTGPDGMVRTFPSERLWDGMFAALLVRHRE